MSPLNLDVQPGDATSNTRLPIGEPLKEAPQPVMSSHMARARFQILSSAAVGGNHSQSTVR